jgi:hypothetical protein
MACRPHLVIRAAVLRVAWRPTGWPVMDAWRRRDTDGGAASARYQLGPPDGRVVGGAGPPGWSALELANPKARDFRRQVRQLVWPARFVGLVIGSRGLEPQELGHLGRQPADVPIGTPTSRKAVAASPSGEHGHRPPPAALSRARHETSHPQGDHSRARRDSRPATPRGATGDLNRRKCARLDDDRKCVWRSDGRVQGDRTGQTGVTCANGGGDDDVRRR